ncbi:hypothetical protein NVV94_20585 [Pseudomonas sp. LS1212]|uniref:hypothetical protein n=1 Tax=Pseudomonas sp. LS1212 TaxID=2972478 RepID=UPI00215D141D|nr:hypothetical protein [Pseudomonas sp. LS1212]UVJ42960.1 hypothetical protein NVV94_20585 [Pseudomonas sp. LS1212]
MKKTAISLLATLALVCCIDAVAKEARLTDAAVAQRLIEESISSYPGNCPCPYNAARNGSRCGKRSAYNRGGGYAPLCFKEDVDKEMVEEYRRQNKG